MSDALRVELPAHRLEKLLSVVYTTADECVLTFGREGLSTRMADPATVMMVSTSLDAEAFTTLGDGQFPAGVNVEALIDHLGFAESDDDLAVLEYDEESRKVDLRVGERYDTKMALIDPDAIRAEPDIPDLEDSLVNEVVVPGRQLSNAIKAADLQSDHVAIKADLDAEHPVRLYAKGDTDATRYKFTDEDVIRADVQESAYSVLSVPYLKEMKAEIPADAEVRIRFGHEFPVKFDYEFADGHGDVLQMIAPRITDDDY